VKRISIGLMALLLAGCGCTAVGCGADLRFGSEMLADWAEAEEFTLEVCVEGDCETLHVGDALSSEYFAMPVDPALTRSVDVELTVTTDERSRTATGTVELDSYRPNGAFCAPVCREADVSINGDTLRNAGSGEIPPRD
jgi:predicted small secreted protein